MVVWTVKVCVLMLGFLIALQRQRCFSYATEILRALRFYKHIRRPFHFQAGITPQCSLHQFLPLQKFLNEISICCLLLSQYPTRISSCVHTELLSFRFLFLLLSLKARLFEAYAVPQLQPQGRKTSRVPTKSWKLCDWSIVSGIFFFVTYLYFLSATKMCHSLNELVNRAMVGRSRWTTIVRGSLFFSNNSQQYVLFWVIDSNYNSQIITLQHTWKLAHQKYTQEVLDLKILLASVASFIISP